MVGSVHGRRSGAAARALAPSNDDLSHNLNGQRLGRKGRVTRERILAATRELIAELPSQPVSLSAVARRASLGMTSLYVYFADLTELILAVLEPVMATAEEAYIAQLRQPWPDDQLAEHSFAFVQSFHDFWVKHSRLLHLRNSMADQQDRRMMVHRVRSAQPVIRLFVEQMGHDPAALGAPANGMATVLYTGIERVVTIATDVELHDVHKEIFRTSHGPNVDNFLKSEARLLELGIREYRK